MLSTDLLRRAFARSQISWSNRATISIGWLRFAAPRMRLMLYVQADGGGEAQRTVVTETRGALSGQRVVRGRERECMSYYADDETHPRNNSAGSGNAPGTAATRAR